MSERSHRGYRRFRAFLQPAISAIRWWGAQTNEYAARIAEILPSATVATIETTGSMKYEGAITDREHPRIKAIARLLERSPGDRFLVAGSTQDPEEDIVLSLWPVLKSLDRNLRLILVPRHPERFDAVWRKIALVEPSSVRRSELNQRSARRSKIILFDCVGELGAVWGIADYAFVGGSLECRRGGQNMIEPAAYGTPVCFGQNVWNFRATVEQLLGCGGATLVRDREELLKTLVGWIQNPADAAAMGTNARTLVLGQLGAVDRTLQGLTPLLPRPASVRKASA